MQTTEAGLLIPDHVDTRKRGTMLQRTFRAMQRFHAAMRQENLGVLVGCLACKTPLDFEAFGQIDSSRPGGRVEVRCACTVREVR